jgi:vesicle-associated membrane protein 7
MAQIIYSIIVRDPDTVITEFSKAQGNFPQITRNIISKIPRNGKFSYSYNDSFTYHYTSEANFLFMCLTESAFAKRVAFLFLDDLKSRFYEKYSKVANTIIAFGVHSEFVEVMKNRMHFYNTDKNVDKITALKASVDQAKNIMVENIEKVLARGEKVEMLVKKTELMSEQAITMKKRAVIVKRRMWMQNLRMYIICGVLVLLLILMTAMSVCSVDFSSCT